MKEIKRFRQTTPDRLEIREDEGYLSLSLQLAITFLAAGLIPTLSGLGIVQITNTAEGMWPDLAIFATGLSCFYACGCFLSRRWVIIDISRGRIQKLWGLLVPMRREDLCLRDYHAVGLSYAIDGLSGCKYPIVLLLGNSGRDIDALCTGYNGSHEEALLEALFLAQFLRLPLEDSTTDQDTKERTSCPWPGFPLDPRQRGD